MPQIPISDEALHNDEDDEEEGVDDDRCCCYGHGVCVGGRRARVVGAIAAACMDPGVPVAPDERGVVSVPARMQGSDGGPPAPGAKIAYWRYLPRPRGASAPLSPRPRLLIVWGAFATPRHFDDVAAWLAAHGVDVACFDHRGVGGSGPCDLAACRHSAGLLAADALAVANALWGTGADVHVFGCAAAIVFILCRPRFSLLPHTPLKQHITKKPQTHTSH
jgi:hypothetical protein